MTEEELKVIISAQTDGLKSGLNDSLNQVNNFSTKATKSVSSMNTAFGTLGKTIAKFVSIGALIKFGKDAINVASDLQEVQNVVDVAFGDMAYKCEEFAKTSIDQFGMSELSAKQTASTYMAMAKSMGLGMESASNMAIEVAKLSGDVASFYNISQSDASTKLKSIFTGETETLKSLGVVMTETNLKEFALTQGITKSYSEMSQAEKVALRYKYVMSALNDASGDFARTSDSWANQTKVLSERFKQLLGIIGNGLIAVLTPFVKMLNNALSVMITFAQNIANLFGVKTQQSIASTGLAISDVSSDYEEMGDTAEESGKKAKQGLMGFDEINNLQQDSSSSSSSAGGITSDLMEIESSTSAVDEAKDKLESLNDIDFTPLKKSLDNLKKSLEPIGKKLGSGLQWLYKNALLPLAKWTISDLLPTFINSLANAFSFLNVVLDYLQPVWEFVWNNILVPIASWTGGLIIDILTGIGNAFLNLTTYLENNKNSWDSTWTAIQESWDGHGAVALQSMLNMFTRLKEMFVNIFNNFLLPVLQTLMNEISELWTNHLQPLWDNVMNFMTAIYDCVSNLIIPIVEELFKGLKPVIDYVVEALSWIFGIVVDVASGIIESLTGIINFITGLFTGDWEKAWNGIKETFQGIWDAIAGIVKGAINGIIMSVNKMISGLETAINVVVKAINKIKITNPFTGEDIWSPHLSEVSFSRIPKLARGGIVDKETTFIAGEHGKEAIIPLENNTEWLDKMASRVVGMMNAVNSMNNNSVTINLETKLNSKVVASETIKDLNIESVRRGYKPILNT